MDNKKVMTSISSTPMLALSVEGLENKKARVAKKRMAIVHTMAASASRHSVPQDE